MNITVTSMPNVLLLLHKRHRSVKKKLLLTL
jgi:hypothetical protein